MENNRNEQSEKIATPEMKQEDDIPVLHNADEEILDPFFKTNYRGNTICFDPWRIQRTLFRFPGLKFPETINLADEENDEDAMEIVLSAVSSAFKIPRFDPSTGTGLLEQEAFRLLDEFITYALAVKKNTDITQDSPLSTERGS